MPKPLKARTIAIVQATVPALAAHGTTITRRMYERLFQDRSIRELFNQSHHGETGAQPKALAAAILAYAQNIDRLAVLGPAVERIAQKHAGLNILPEHYPHVAQALLAAIRDVLGEAASEEVLAAWGEAYWHLAHILIGREAEIYRAMAAAPGGWNGWRRFVVARRAQESAIITSFELRPEDGGQVMRHRPGQYLTFQLEIPGRALPLKRNYSISCAPNGRSYRITVKREPGGIVSNWLHDEVTPGTILQVAPPAGEFFLPERPERPVVLLSGGVGLTPMVSMLEAIAADQPDLPTHYVHGALNGTTHAMRRQVQDLADRAPGVTVRTFYAAPGTADRMGEHYDHPGLITTAWLQDNTPTDQADFYLCGPKPFLRSFIGGLARAGVPDQRIHYEFFGPADELLAA